MRIPRRAVVLLVVAWVVVVLYPNPGVLIRSVVNVVIAHGDAVAAAPTASSLPDDPRRIEAFVLSEQVPYAFDWQTADVPWYFPTAAEALTAGAGDCESRAMVLTSILSAKGIPNELRMSLDHIWVDYPGKRDTTIENAALEIAGRRDGRLFLQFPGDFDLGQEVADQLSIYWAPAPGGRVFLLLAGLALLPFVNVFSAALTGGGLAAGRRDEADGALFVRGGGRLTRRRRRGASPQALRRVRKAI